MIKKVTFFCSLMFVMFFIYQRFTTDRFAAPKNLFISGEQPIDSTAIVCSLTEPKLIERKALLKREIFSKVIESKESDYGYIYFFKDENDLLEKLSKFIIEEQKCCPFFTYNISIQSNTNGIALEIAGPIGAKMLLRNIMDET